MEIITTLHYIEDIKKLKKAGVDGIIVASSFFAIKMLNTFDNDALKDIIQRCKTEKLRVYIMMNRLFMEEDLPHMQKQLLFLKQQRIDGIYYSDDALYWEAKRLQMHDKLIYQSDTLICNQQDAKFYIDEGIKYVSLSHGLSLQECIAILKAQKGKVEMLIHGRINIMFSKRRLIENYMQFLNRKESYTHHEFLTLKEKTREQDMPIVEEKAGTAIYSPYTLCSYEEIQTLAKSGLGIARIDGIFHDINYVCETIAIYKAILQHKIDATTSMQTFQKKYPNDALSSGFYHLTTVKSKRLDDAKN